tara:strand:- start:40 stop:1017 length:978 start_codon:yes stop_codon:yes gene_type:complete
MIPISHFINKNPCKTFATINKQAAYLELMDCNSEAKCHYSVYKSSKYFRDFKNISYITTNINLHDVFINDKNFEYCFAYYYENNEFLMLQLFEKIIEDISNNKSIFINVDVDGYGYNENEEDYFYTHGLSIILQPCKNNYKGFIINSHGNDIMCDFDVILSRRRIKKINYKEGVDVALMKKLVAYLNKHLTDNSLQTIKYKGDIKDTYLGTNLQCSDWRGYCYMFPFIIFHYYGYYYDDSRSLNNELVIESSKKLLERGFLIKFVHGIFAEFNKRFKEKIIEIDNSENKKYFEELEKIIQKQDYRFIKDFASPYLSFLRQKCLKS